MYWQFRMYCQELLVKAKFSMSGTAGESRSYVLSGTAGESSSSVCIIRNLVNAAVLYVLSGTAGKSSSAVCIVRNCWCW
jgi:hypothetical protein